MFKSQAAPRKAHLFSGIQRQTCKIAIEMAIFYFTLVSIKIIDAVAVAPKSFTQESKKAEYTIHLIICTIKNYIHIFLDIFLSCKFKLNFFAPFLHTNRQLHKLRVALVFLSSFLHLETIQQPVAQFSHAFSVVQPSLPVSQVPQYAAGPGCKISLFLICSHNCQLFFPGHNNLYCSLLAQIP